MAKKARFKTLREFVDSHHRSVKQQEIAAKLGLAPADLSAYLGGKRPGSDTALRISREHNIDLEGLLDPEAKTVGA